MKKKLAKKIKPPVPDGPLTASQLMDVVIPKKLNFLKAPLPYSLEKGPKKLNFILPKPSPDCSVANMPTVSEEEALSGEQVPTVDNQQVILQPMYTLSYQPMTSEHTTSQTIPASVLSNVVSLHLSEPTTSPTTSSVQSNTTLAENSSAVRHKLPLIVAQRPSSLASSRQISPRKETSQQEQNFSETFDGSSMQSSV